jgi:cysteinyl-tRNA synthetase
MDWTAEKARDAEATLRKWYRLAETAADGAAPHAGVVAALADDLNTHAALMELHQLAQAEDAAALRSSLQFLGFMGAGVPAWASEGSEVLADLAARFAALREAAKLSKDFGPVDAMKAALIAAGVEVRMSRDGVDLVPAEGFDAAKLEALI